MDLSVRVAAAMDLNLKSASGSVMTLRAATLAATPAKGLAVQNRRWSKRKPTAI
jgi:hypothetical protein